MYLLARPWSRKEKISIVTLTVALPWAALLSLLHLLSSNTVSLEMALAGSGFLAIGFTLLASLGLLLASTQVSILDKTLLLRKIMFLSLVSGACVLPLSSFFPLNMVLLLVVQSTILYKRLSVWQQIFPEDSVRLEPIFLLQLE